MKKTITIFLSLLICLSFLLVACNEEESETKKVTVNISNSNAIMSDITTQNGSKILTEDVLDMRGPTHKKVFKLTFNDKVNLGVTGVLEEDFLSKKTLSFYMLTDGEVLFSHKALEGCFSLFSEEDLFDAKDYVKIYNEDEVIMTEGVANQWLKVEINLYGLEANQIDLGFYLTAEKGQSIFISHASFNNSSFGLYCSPITITYNGAPVGGMVSYNYLERQSNPDGRTGIITEDNGMRFTREFHNNLDAVRVDAKGNRQTILQPFGFDSDFIKDNNISKIRFYLFTVDRITENIMVRAFNKNSSVPLFHSSLAIDTEVDSGNTFKYLSIDGENGVPIANGIWQKIEITLNEEDYLINDTYGYSLFAGLDLHLFLDGGVFFITRVELV